MTATYTDVFIAYSSPLVFSGLIFIVYIYTLLRHPLLPLRDFESYKEKAFATGIFLFGPMAAGNSPPQLAALLASSSGIILDVGPGAGDQVFRFSNAKGIHAIYGIEPCIDLHEKLRINIARAGLADKYRILPATADLPSILPQLIKSGLVKEKDTFPKDLQLFDEIVCVRVLCSVPDLPGSITDLYSLLKPGGRFVICEHVLNTHSTVARLVQHFLMLFGWKYFMGNCSVVRDTLRELQAVAKKLDGGWARVEVTDTEAFGPTMHVVGSLTKAK